MKKKMNNPLPFFFIWVIGIYFAMYGIASQRYENRRDTLESKESTRGAGGFGITPIRG
jgi:hypothetical protein